MDNLSYVFGLIHGGINEKMDVLFNTTVASVITELAVISKNALILYMIVWGLLMLYGRIQDTFQDGIKRITLIALVIACSQHLPFYSNNIAHHLEGLSGGLIQLLGSNTFPAMNAADNTAYTTIIVGYGYDVSPIAQSLDNALTGFYRALSGALEAADWKAKIVIALQSIFLSVALYAFLGISAFLSLISLIVVKALLMVGPIFFICLLFDGTRNYFSGWLSLIVNYSLVAFLAMIFSLLIIKMLVTSLIAMGASEFNYLTIGFVIVIAFIGLLLLLQVQSMAASIAGGLSLNTRIPYLRQTGNKGHKNKSNSETQPITNPPKNTVENKS